MLRPTKTGVNGSAEGKQKGQKEEKGTAKKRGQATFLSAQKRCRETFVARGGSILPYSPAAQSSELDLSVNHAELDWHAGRRRAGILRHHQLHSTSRLGIGTEIAKRTEQMFKCRCPRSPG